MPTYLKFARICGLCCGVILPGAAVLQAYEQGTYLIFQMVDSLDAQTTGNRIAVERSVFAETKNTESAENTASDVTAPTQEHSNFEIDFSTFGQQKTSAFDTTYDTDTDSTEEQPESTSSFDLNLDTGSTSLFGD